MVEERTASVKDFCQKSGIGCPLTGCWRATMEDQKKRDEAVNHAERKSRKVGMNVDVQY